MVLFLLPMRDFDLSKKLVTLVYPLIQSLYLKIMSRDRYANYTELSRNETENRDYRRVIVRNPLSNVAVIAPHGGFIEPGASEIARAIAGENFNLYLFEGIKPRRNFKDLHITSQHFDEPQCLGLLAECEIVIAIHGYITNDERVLVGGRDMSLRDKITLALRRMGLTAKSDGHKYQALDKNNICNRGSCRRGVQLEISGVLRRSSNAKKLVQAVRGVLGI